MKQHKMKVEITSRRASFNRHVIPNRAEGAVRACSERSRRDPTSDAAIPAVNGTAWLNSPPQDVIPGVSE